MCASPTILGGCNAAWFAAYVAPFASALSYTGLYGWCHSAFPAHFFWLTYAHAPVASERGLHACPIHLACPNRCPAMHEEPSLVLYGGVPAWTSLERLPAARAACPPAVLAVGLLGQRLSLPAPRKLTWGTCFLFLLFRKLIAGPDVRVCTLRPYRSDPAGPPSQDLRGARLGARCSKPRAPHALCSALCKHTASKSC